MYSFHVPLYVERNVTLDNVYGDRTRYMLAYSGQQMFIVQYSKPLNGGVIKLFLN
jgi:hypothetical protein